jgi:hypothetical protein
VSTRDTELVGNDVQRSARAEQVKSVLKPSTATREDGLAETPSGIDHDLRDFVCRQPDQPYVALRIEFESARRRPFGW